MPVNDQLRITTTTQDYFLPRLVDVILNSNVLFTRMVGKAKKWRGEQLKQAIKYKKNTTGTSFAGADLLSTTATDNRDKMKYDPKFYQITSVVHLDELSVNATPDGFLNLADITLQSDAEDMADSLGTIFFGDGTGNSSKDPNGLENLVDDGTNVATIGGLTRSSYAGNVLKSTVTASGGTLTLAKLDTLESAVGSGAQRPTLHVVTETIWNLYGQLLAPQERIVKTEATMRGGVVGGTGYSALFYRGKPVIADEKCTSGVWYALNEDFIDWYALPMADTEPVKYKNQIEGNDYSQVTGLGFSWSGWIKPANAATRIAHIYLGGNLVTFNPKRHGKLTGITAI